MNKDELLRIYSAYLPHQLRICDSIHNPDFILDEDNLGDILHDAEILNTIKPYLYDLSYLTKEIEHEGEKFVPIQRLSEKNNWKSTDDDDFAYLLDSFYDYKNLQYSVVTDLLSWHFNIFQLPENQFINKATLK